MNFARVALQDDTLRDVLESRGQLQPMILAFAHALRVGVERIVNSENLAIYTAMDRLMPPGHGLAHHYYFDVDDDGGFRDGDGNCGLLTTSQLSSLVADSSTNILHTPHAVLFKLCRAHIFRRFSLNIEVDHSGKHWFSSNSIIQGKHCFSLNVAVVTC